MRPLDFEFYLGVLVSIRELLSFGESAPWELTICLDIGYIEACLYKLFLAGFLTS